MPPMLKERELGPTVRLAVMTAMTNSAEHSGKFRYHFHKDYDVPKMLPTEPTKQPEAPVGRLAMATNQGGESDLNAKGFGKEVESPTVRLAAAGSLIGRNPQRLEKLMEDAPSGRLAVTDDGMPSKAARYPEALGGEKPVVRLAMSTNHNAIEKGLRDPNEPLAPSVKLAHVPGAQGDNVLIGQRGVAHLPDTSLPALLVSYFYLAAWEQNKHRYHYRDWVMDSGAFSAFNSGAVIVLQDYIDCCKRLMVDDPTLTEIYSLDVIGDPEAGLANTEEMWRQGVPAIPCFHYGEPWELLMKLKAKYPKIAIGGCVGKRDKDAFAGQCFSRVWPHKLHGFGFGAEKSIMMYPWHSVDATNWEIAPCKYGTWRAFDGQRVSVRGSQQNLRAEVEWYLDLEQRARTKWKKQMIQLEELYPTVKLSDQANALVETSVRLAWAGGEGGAVYNGLTPPSVRLAVQPASRSKGENGGLLKPGQEE